MTLFAAERWIYRRDYIRHLAVMIIQNYILAIGHRFLHKIGFSKKSTAAIQSEILPSTIPFTLILTPSSSSRDCVWTNLSNRSGSLPLHPEFARIRHSHRHGGCLVVFHHCGRWLSLQGRLGSYRIPSRLHPWRADPMVLELFSLICKFPVTIHF